MKPTVGRIVQYCKPVMDSTGSNKTVLQAAIISEVLTGDVNESSSMVNLTVFPGKGGSVAEFRQSIGFSSVAKEQKWIWPAKE